MPIVEATISAQIDALIETSSQQEPEQAIITYKDGLATIIATAIRSATVTVAAGIPVATAGSAVAQTGVTTAIGTGTLS